MRGLTDDERALLAHLSLWGSDGYPVRKLGCRWTWGPWRSVKGPPVVWRTRREAVASFEAFYDVLVRARGEEAQRRAERTRGSPEVTP